jgi:hypothetical protein
MTSISVDLVARFDEMPIPCLVTDTLANESACEPSYLAHVAPLWYRCAVNC